MYKSSVNLFTQTWVFPPDVTSLPRPSWSYFCQTRDFGCCRLDGPSFPVLSSFGREVPTSLFLRRCLRLSEPVFPTSSGSPHTLGPLGRQSQSFLCTVDVPVTPPHSSLHLVLSRSPKSLFHPGRSR